jgi:hypothetical protein
MEVSQFKFLASQIANDVHLIRPIPAFEYRGMVLTELVLHVCRQFNLNDSAEIPLLAVQFLERLFEHYIDKKMTPASIEYEIITCILLATKILTSNVFLFSRIRRFYPMATAKFMLAKEMSTLQQLLEMNQLSKPTLMTTFEVLAAALQFHPEFNLKEFLDIGEKVLLIIQLNCFSLACRMFCRERGRMPTYPNDFTQVRVILRNLSFLVGSAVIVVFRIMNYHDAISYLLRKLEDLTKYKASDLNYFACLVLKGISSTVGRKKGIQNSVEKYRR